MSLLNRGFLLPFLALLTFQPGLFAGPATWMPDNGNGSYTNPLFQDEFSDPDIIRVGEDFYLAGTTMHAMPGLVVLHSRDLVNWRFLSYATPALDLGPEYRLEDGRTAYGQGIWAPCLRFHEGVFYLFSNVNRQGLQIFTSRDPAGPWTRRSLKRGLHDLSVLFDDDGRVYAVFGYDEVRIIEFLPDLSGFVEGSERVLIPRGNGMGEGHHFYRIEGLYYIVSADYAPVGRMQCARAASLDGPWETVCISALETMGTSRGLWLNNPRLALKSGQAGAAFDIVQPGPRELGAVPLHQGGIVDLPNGDWWGVSMMDYKSVGRTTFLSPVTWKSGWPYFGLPGNLGRTPRTWIKPAVEASQKPAPTYERNDAFSAPVLGPVWQWNHVPVAGKWSLSERPGFLRLHTLPAEHFLFARNTLTQRAIGPVSIARVALDFSALAEGDVAGLGLLNIPQAWLGISRRQGDWCLEAYDQAGDRRVQQALPPQLKALCAECDLEQGVADLFCELSDGSRLILLQGVQLPYQLGTFQGPRYSLFAYNRNGAPGGFADFDAFTVEEPLCDRGANLPLGRIITLRNLADGSLAWASPRSFLHSVAVPANPGQALQTRFRVLDRGSGRVVLQSLADGRFVTVLGEGLSADVRLTEAESPACLFQWQDLLRGHCMLLSLHTQRLLSKSPGTGEPYSAQSPGAAPDRKDGSVFEWTEVFPNE